jgi:hypothetical protein
MPKKIRNPNAELARLCRALAPSFGAACQVFGREHRNSRLAPIDSDFDLRDSFGFRPSAFGFISNRK